MVKLQKQLNNFAFNNSKEEREKFIKNYIKLHENALKIYDYYESVLFHTMNDLDLDYAAIQGSNYHIKVSISRNRFVIPSDIYLHMSIHLIIDVNECPVIADSDKLISIYDDFKNSNISMKNGILRYLLRISHNRNINGIFIFQNSIDNDLYYNLLTIRIYNDRFYISCCEKNKLFRKILLSYLSEKSNQFEKKLDELCEKINW